MEKNPESVSFENILTQAFNIQGMFEVLLLAVQKMDENGYNACLTHAGNHMFVMQDKIDTFVNSITNFQDQLERTDLQKGFGE